jgi:hypothetical protein
VDADLGDAQTLWRLIDVMEARFSGLDMRAPA